MAMRASIGCRRIMVFTIASVVPATRAGGPRKVYRRGREPGKLPEIARRLGT
jgi:hypothetical protein